MTAGVRAAGRPIGARGFDPLRSTWALLTNVKFALLLVGIAGAAGMIGVVVPQLPAQMRSNPAARAAWLEIRRDQFGGFTDPMDRLGLFDVFHSPWFTALWAVIIVAVTVCTVSRFRPTWRSVHHPQKRVPDAYFDHAHHRASFSHAGGAGALERALRARRYRVERTQDAGGATYLFAERFAWSQYGTFLSHLALLMLLVGGLLTALAGFDRTMVVAERTPAAPVFDDPGPGQIFVKVLDAVRGIDGEGNVIDYRSQLEVRRGAETVTCTTTVNDPCEAFGYRVHQAAFFDDVARLRINGPDGRLLYDDVLDFENRTTAAPVLRVTGPRGEVLFDQVLPQMGTDPGADPGPADDLAVAALTFPVSAAAGETVTYAAAWRIVDGRLQLALTGADLPPVAVPEGGAIEAGPYRIAYVGAAAIPALRVDDMPGALEGEPAWVQMPTDREGRAYLLVSGVDTANMVLEGGRPGRSAGGHSYTFGGRLEASGVSVRRDPGDTFIWIAVGMAMVGLGITFYVPRRRLWAKVTPERTQLAGVAERTTRFGRELRVLGAALGAEDALLPGDRAAE